MSREWKEISFGDSSLEIEDGDRGKNYPSKSQLLKEGYCPFLNNKNVIGDKLNFEEVDFITKEKDGLLRKGKAYPGDIILTTRGSVGNVALFHNNISFKFVRINSGMVIIRNNNLFNLDFLYQQLKSPYMKSQYNNLVTGSAQPQLPIRDIKKLKLLVPPIKEQKTIAHILSTLDEKIETNNQINKTLEKMAQTIFKHWFVDFEFPNENGEPYKSSGGEMVDSELGMIPKGWEVKELNEIADLTMGLSPKSSSYNLDNIGIPLLNGAADFENGLINAKKYTTEPTRVCKKNDLVFCIRATIGNITFSDKEYCLGRGVASITPKDDKFMGLLYFNLLMSMNRLIANATGSVILGLSKPDINNMKLIVADKRILGLFYKLSNSILQSRHCNEFEIKKLTNLRDLLLPKLMSGEIRVPLEGVDTI